MKFKLNPHPFLQPRQRERLWRLQRGLRCPATYVELRYLTRCQRFDSRGFETQSLVNIESSTLLRTLTSCFTKNNDETLFSSSFQFRYAMRNIFILFVFLAKRGPRSPYPGLAFGFFHEICVVRF